MTTVADRMEHHLAEWDEKTIRQWNYFFISFIVSIYFCVFTQWKPPVFSAKSIQWNLSENAKSRKPLFYKDFQQKNKHDSFNTNGIQTIVLIWYGPSCFIGFKQKVSNTNGFLREDLCVFLNNKLF